MDAYSKLDHETLVRNLNAVCKELGVLLDSAGLYCGPPALTRADVEENIPYALHRIALRAGWIEESVEVGEDGPGVDVFPGGGLVKESYKEWFLQLLERTLADLRVRASANKAAQDRDYERLIGQFPKGKRAKLVKRDWPSKYDDGTETPKGILDRRRNKMHLEWHDLLELIEAAFVKRESDRRKRLGLERAKRLGFSIDSLLSIRRGCTLPQSRLEAVASVISPKPDLEPKATPISWQALRWRDRSTSE